MANAVDEIKVAMLSLSTDQLAMLVKAFRQRISDMQETMPSYQMALDAGVEDHSYGTVRNGFVASYYGEAVIVMPNGTTWKAVGHGPNGNAYDVYRQGFIEFIPVH